MKKKNQREALLWEETKENYGSTIHEIKAEFQARGLLSVRSNPVYYCKVKIGSKHTYCCSKESCDFFARIVEDYSPNSIPKVETASIQFCHFVC